MEDGAIGHLGPYVAVTVRNLKLDLATTPVHPMEAQIVMELKCTPTLVLEEVVQVKIKHKVFNFLKLIHRQKWNVVKLVNMVNMWQ